MSENDDKIIATTNGRDLNGSKAHRTNETQTKASDIVEGLRQLLGNSAILIPIPTGHKGPKTPGWQNTSLDVMQDPNHLESLRNGNIGVLLGTPSGGLCTIDIDSDEAVDPFLELNPKLRESFRTKGKRGVQIWIRIPGVCPKLTKIKGSDGSEWGEWRADGGQSVVYGIHPEGMPYKRLVDSEPVELTFDEINWPDGLTLPWLQDSEYNRLVAEHGRAYSVNSKGGLQINDYFFVARYQKEHLVLWEPLEEEFYQYNTLNGLWERITEDEISLQFGLDLKRAGDQVGNESFIWKRKSGMLSALVRTLRGFVSNDEAFKKKSPAIHLANGMLDLKSDPPRFVSFHPDFYSRNICPLEFDPEAECPRFLNELLRPALDDDDISLLQRWAGSVLLGANPAQRILLMTGTPGGGKSTLIEIIEKIIGEKNVAQIRTKHLNKQFEFFKFLGKTLLTGKDVGANFLSEDGAEVLKSLVGNDLVDAEKKNGNEQFQLRGNFNMAITCNSKLRIRLEGDAGAWARRLLIIDYTKPKPKECIADFADKLIAAEGPGILNWMIEGAIQYLQELDCYGNLVLTDEQKDRVDALLKESDSVRQFVQDRVQPDKGCTLTVIEAQRAYFDFCEERGWQPVSPQNFKTVIPDLMLEIHHVSKRNDISRGFDKTHRGFKNVSIREGSQL